MILTELLYVAIIPAAVAAMVVFAAQQARFKAPVAWALAIGCGYMVGQFALARRNTSGASIGSLFQPREAVEWLPYAVLVAIAVTVLGSYLPRSWRPAMLVLAGGLCVALPLRLLAGTVYPLEWSTAEHVAYTGLLAATFAVTWLGLAAAHSNEHPRLRAVLLIIVGAGTAVVCARSGVFVYGELCGVVMATVSGALLVSRENGLEGTAGVITFSLGSLVLLSYFFAELTLGNAGLLLLAIVLAGGRLPLPPFFLTRPVWQQGAVRAALALVPLVIALATVFMASHAETPADPYSV
jgi:hypothetical protein